jgi:hypothetical protein
MAVQIVDAKRAHIGRIARRMRAMDRLECAAKGRTPACALRYSLASSSFAMTALVDGSPHAMFGLTPYSLASGVGRPWFLGTDEVYRHPRDMVRTGEMLVEIMQDSFRRLENVIAAANDQGIRLLKRWGFTIGEETQVIGGVRFLPFWRGEHV